MRTQGVGFNICDWPQDFDSKGLFTLCFVHSVGFIFVTGILSTSEKLRSHCSKNICLYSVIAFCFTDILQDVGANSRSQVFHFK